MKITVPNIITTIRFFAIPVMAYYIYAGESFEPRYKVVAFVMFISIWATDVLDGYIAIKFNQISDFGKLFDPFVDKLFQFVTALMMFIVGKIPLWIPIAIAVKEIVMVIGGAVLLKKYKLVVYAKWYGKLATFLFVTAFCVLFFIPQEMSRISVYLFILPLGFSVFAYVKYFFDNVIPVIYHKSKRKIVIDNIDEDSTRKNIK